MGFLDLSPAEQRRRFGIGWDKEVEKTKQWRKDKKEKLNLQKESNTSNDKNKWKAKPYNTKKKENNKNKKTIKTKAPEYVSGWEGKEKPIDTTGRPTYWKKTTPPKTPGNLKKATIYKPNAMTGSPWGDADLAGKGHTGPSKGTYGDVRQITEDTKYGGMQKIKNKVKTPTKDKKDKPTLKSILGFGRPATEKEKRGLRQMNKARSSMRQGGWNFKTYK